MATLELKFGDLFNSDADAIGHGTNTHGQMSGGIAVLFKKRHPRMHERYQELCEIFGDDLGGSTFLYFDEQPNTEPLPYSYIANIFSQKAPGANATVELLIDGLKDAYAALWGEAEVDEPHIAIPLIGCGIGGLDWDRDVHPALIELTSELPADWKLTVVSNEHREGFLG